VGVLHKCFTMLNWAVWKIQKDFEGGGERKRGGDKGIERRRGWRENTRRGRENQKEERNKEESGRVREKEEKEEEEKEE
jgi:hypothetical protein